MSSGLAALRDGEGWIRVLALDHRDSLRAFLAGTTEAVITPDALTSIKRHLAAAIAPLATGVMLEPEYSIPSVSSALPPAVGFTAALEAQGYLADPEATPTTLLDGWSVAQAAACGAAAAKLLVPFHPDHPLAPTQLAFAGEVLDECRRVGIALVLEPLWFGVDPASHTEVALRTVELFAALQPDLLKLGFPAPAGASPDAAAAACAAVDQRCHMPWALLSGGGSFDAFAEQVACAVEHGASGFMVGRALWGEAARASVDERDAVITSIVLPRWARLHAITSGRPVRERRQG